MCKKAHILKREHFMQIIRKHFWGLKTWNFLWLAHNGILFLSLIVVFLLLSEELNWCKEMKLSNTFCIRTVSFVCIGSTFESKAKSTLQTCRKITFGTFNKFLKKFWELQFWKHPQSTNSLSNNAFFGLWKSSYDKWDFQLILLRPGNNFCLIISNYSYTPLPNSACCAFVEKHPA